MFLGDHGWFDKRFIYEESFQMPLVARYPPEIKAGSVIKDIVQNVDFAATMLDIAGLQVPSYMQGKSFRKVLQGETPEDWDQLAYHVSTFLLLLLNPVFSYFGMFQSTTL